MQYPITSPINGIDPGLWPFKVLSDELYEEWVKITPLSNLIGSELNRPIYRHKLRDGEGLQFRVPRLEALDYKNPVIDLDQVSGSGQQQKVTYDSVNTTFQSFPLQLVGRDIVRLGTPIDLPPRVRNQLIEVNKRNLNWDLFNQMTVLNYPDRVNTKPSYDRIYTAGYAPTRGTYNALQGLTAVLNGLAAVPATTSFATGRQLMSLKRMAEFGGKADTATALSQEAAIQPPYMMSMSGWPMNEYILLVDPAVVEQLTQDTFFTSSTFTRGFNLPDQPQPIHGADYIGRFMGMHVISCKDLMEYRLTSADGNKLASWNILLGAGALTLGWHEYPFIVEKTDEVDRLQIFTTHEQRGQKALKFPSKINPAQLVEQGIIHYFTCLDPATA
jgi:hypothetical protein